MQNKMKLFVAGQLLAIIMIVALLAVPAISKANSNQADSAAVELTDVYRQALTVPLARAVSEVKDPQIAEFSQKLVQAYGLENAASQSNVDDASGLANLLPDVAKIHRTAMDMPLIEAGKQMKDKELSDFYQSFISSIGVGK
jgi:Zn-dependent protease with chaperone function